MGNFNAPFRFDYVGSFLRPAHLKQARADFEAGQITKAELESIENEAITNLIKKQKAALHKTAFCSVINLRVSFFTKLLLRCYSLFRVLSESGPFT